jgi:NAD(P)-dependent dehydrogenase (short-subunit alcohol dehydrogenase family)
VEVSGKNIVVTGGANGIGRALCERFAKEGAARITVVDLDEANAAKVADSVGGKSFRVDVGSRSEIETLVRAVEADGGPIDLFVSNAGIAIVGGPEVDVESWNRIWDINVMAHVNAAHALLPSMLERGEGYLLNTCSAVRPRVFSPRSFRLPTPSPNMPLSRLLNGFPSPMATVESRYPSSAPRRFEPT